MFLDEASRSRLAARYPEASGRSASYVLLEATKVTSDKTRPAIFAPLMCEPATATVTGKRTVGNLSTLRTDVQCAGGPIEGMSGYVPSLTWGGSGDDEAAHRGAEEGTDGLEPEPALELTGTICRGDYWHGQRSLTPSRSPLTRRRQVPSPAAPGVPALRLHEAVAVQRTFHGLGRLPQRYVLTCRRWSHRPRSLRSQRRHGRRTPGTIHWCVSLVVRFHASSSPPRSRLRQANARPQTLRRQIPRVLRCHVRATYGPSTRSGQRRRGAWRTLVLLRCLAVFVQ